MLGRCKYPSHTSWKWYGARGITVCSRWLEFENFMADMGMPPFPKATIERKNNSDSYSPENCYWATQLEQANNRRTTVHLEFNGTRATMLEWSKRVNLSVELIRTRYEHHWPIERLLTTPKLHD